MTRDELVDALIQDDLEAIGEAGAFEWITNRLLDGMPWMPYNKMTDDELSFEYRNRFVQEAA